MRDSTIYDEHWQSKQFFDLYVQKSREKYFRELLVVGGSCAEYGIIAEYYSNTIVFIS